MEIKFYNSLTNRKALFKTITPNEVKIYICGVTVYDKCHLGHARGAINFDVLRNLFHALNYKVTYVKNYTDIDDKIIIAANKKNIPYHQLTEEMIRLHDRDMASLDVAKPDIAPKATEHIPEIIRIIETLIEKEFAYTSQGSVFFRVRKFKEYGKLSGKKIDDLEIGARVEVDEAKEDGLDFALWKAAKPDEPFWDSPWGKGRPGWHIECSAMSQKYLGETFDIHAGGNDLIFPHHENEIAQSEGAHDGKTMANYWLHTGMVMVEGQKMAKSLGNFALIEDLLQKYNPELLRFFILSTQYGHAINFSNEGIRQSVEGLDRLYGALEKYESTYETLTTASIASTKETDNYRNRFLEAMCDDLNTPQAIGILFEAARQFNIIMHEQIPATAYYHLIKELGHILGIFRVPAAEWLKNPRIKTAESGLSDDAVEALLQQREEARRTKDWGTADQVRDTLKEANIVIEDREGKTHWYRK